MCKTLNFAAPRLRCHAPLDMHPSRMRGSARASFLQQTTRKRNVATTAYLGALLTGNPKQVERQRARVQGTDLTDAQASRVQRQTLGVLHVGRHQ